MSMERLSKVAFVGSYLPRKCGIATFTYDLCSALTQQESGPECFVVAVSDRPKGYAYSSDVRFEITEQDLPSYRQAAEFKPDSPEYVLGYASALVQARRFADAVALLRQVVRADPQNYAVHANLATALYELKRYGEALSEYEWIVSAKPEIVVAHYFIATAHDYLGEYPEALASYEKFLAAADAKTNQLEIDKVRLRLPGLRRQIQLGEGAKKKP